jgi:quinoprotein glucose dehydrogenase
VLQQIGRIQLGRAARGQTLLTKTLLIVAQEGTTQRESEKASDFEIHEAKICAYDKATGRVVGEVLLPRNATGAPMTYILDGKQFIAIPTGGANLPAELLVLSLP